MWFRVLSLVIAVALLGKAVIALAAPRGFTPSDSASIPRSPRRANSW